MSLIMTKLQQMLEVVKQSCGDGQRIDIISLTHTVANTGENNVLTSISLKVDFLFDGEETAE